MHLSRSTRPGLAGLAVLALASGLLVATGGAGLADERGGAGQGHQAHLTPGELAVNQVNLVSDLSTVGASLVDPDLVNPWGLALGPTTPPSLGKNRTHTATPYSPAPPSPS